MDVKLPNLGEGADSGTVVNVYVKAGDRIEKGQPLIELENEKAVATIPSTADGTIAAVNVKNGDKISVGHRIVSITEAGGAAAPAAQAPVHAQKPIASHTPEPVAQPALASASEEPLPAVSSAGVAAAPSIRKMASELGIDLTKVRGSAPGGRIVLADVRNYIQKLIGSAQSAGSHPVASATTSQPAAKAEAIDFSQWGPVQHKPMSSLRKVISRRMQENWNAIPHVTQFDDADVSALQELAKKRAPEFEKQGAKLTVTVLVIRALVDTLKKHPIFNTSMDEAAGEIIFKEYFNIGIAVDTEAGLIVPVIKGVDKKSLLEIARELTDLAGKARARKVSSDELKGGTFTISNQGGIGSGHFTPIVNKPEVAILGMGRSAVKPVVRDGAVTTRLMLPLALSYDHRVVDGGGAARFMVDLVQALEKFDAATVKI